MNKFYTRTLSGELNVNTDVVVQEDVDNKVEVIDVMYLCTRRSSIDLPRVIVEPQCSRFIKFETV